MQKGYKPGEQKVVDNLEKVMNWAQKPKLPLRQKNPLLGRSPWWRRVVAVILDFFSYTIISFVGYMAFVLPLAKTLDPETGGDVSKLSSVLALIAVIVFMVVPVTILSAWLLARKKPSKNGRTWGKATMGLVVVRDNGQPWTFWPAVWRQFVLKLLVPSIVAVAIVLLGGLLNTTGALTPESIGIIFSTIAVIALLAFMLWPLFDQQSRGLHDRWSKSHVNYEPK